MTAMTTFHCYPSRIPTSTFGQWDVGATGRIPKRSSTNVALSVASVMSSISRRVASAPPWSTPSTINIIYLECKLLDITTNGFDFIRMLVLISFLDNI
jgi:hypothetical protein